MKLEIPNEVRTTLITLEHGNSSALNYYKCLGYAVTRPSNFEVLYVTRVAGPKSCLDTLNSQGVALGCWVPPAWTRFTSFEYRTFSVGMGHPRTHI